MSDSYLDNIPSREREKIRKRMRSPEEYERLREKVKGPEDLEREMEKNAEFAEVKLHLESDPAAQEKAREMVRSFAKEKGIDAAFESKNAALDGHFDVVVSEKNHEPHLSVHLKNAPKGAGEKAPSGNVSETLQLSSALQKQIVASFTLK